MLVSNQFVTEEHKYRGDILRDQYQRETSRVGKAVVALVVAGAIALAACGAPTDGNNAIDAVKTRRATDLEYAFSGNEAPVAQGSRGLLSQILGTYAADPEMAFSGIQAPAAGIGSLLVPQTRDLEVEFSGVEAPVAQGAGLNRQSAEPASGPR